MTRTALVLVASIALSAVAEGEPVTIVQAERSIVCWAAGFDYEYDDGLSDEGVTDAVTGAFADEVDADLVDWWGGAVGHGTGAIASALSPALLEVTYETSGFTDSGLFQADAGGEGETLVTLELAGPVRATITGDAQGAGYTIATAFFRPAGAASLGSLIVQGDDADQVATQHLLPPGTYELDVSLMSWAFGGGGITVTAEGSLAFRVRLDVAGDTNGDRTVDVDDLVTVIVDWGCTGGIDDCPGDVNADGEIDVDDLVLVITSFG